MAQDYVELIAALIAETGEARAIDMARRLGVTHVTVGRTIQRLQRDGLVTAQPYRSIFLTDAARNLAEKSRRRHEIVIEFLRSIGVPESVAQSDAEGIEHHVTEETPAAFLNSLANAPDANRRADARAVQPYHRHSFSARRRTESRRELSASSGWMWLSFGS